MTVNHAWDPYPSRQGCVRCPYPPSAHPEPEPTVHPFPEWEAEVIRAAADGLADPESLIRLADRRTLPGPLRDFTDRDYDWEFLEELADGGGNYGPWAARRDQHLVEMGLMDDETARQRADLRQRAIGYVVAAFSLIEQVREL